MKSSELLTTIKAKSIEIWGAISDWFKGIWEDITAFFSDAWDFIKDLFFSYHPLGVIIDNWQEIID